MFQFAQFAPCALCIHAPVAQAHSTRAQVSGIRYQVSDPGRAASPRTFFLIPDSWLLIPAQALCACAGFPHSDTPGSKLHCQLPEVFRRLARPSSPVAAKASTTCTCSLDPITLNPGSDPRSSSTLLNLLETCPVRQAQQSQPI
jgi:hypothetical protein